MANILYLTVVDEIKKRIISGELSPGDMLGSEATLMKQYNVSRMTLRKSLSLLSNEGYIYSVPGKGNYVCKPDIDVYEFRFRDIRNLIPDIDDIKLLTVTAEDAAKSEAHKIFQGSEQLIRIDRLIYSENQPIAIEFVYTPYVPNQPVVEDKLHFANYAKVLEKKYPFSIKKDLEISILKAPSTVSKKLPLDEKDVVCIEQKILRKEDDSPLTYSKLFLKKQFFTFKANTPEDNSNKRIF